VLYPTNFHEDLIDVERATVPPVSLLESTSVSSAKLDTSEPDGFVADPHTSFGEQVFDITAA
jgi:hypothetical protein